jgi:hypothetical protein
LVIDSNRFALLKIKYSVIELTRKERALSVGVDYRSTGATFQRKDRPPIFALIFFCLQKKQPLRKGIKLSFISFR